MTTIAYKDGVIAYDSRVTRGSLIDHDDYEKLIHRNGHQFLFAGCGADFPALMDEFFGVKASDKPLDANGLVVTNGRLCQIGRDAESGFWLDEVWMERSFAIGSGRDFALAAMDMGATAKEAVEAAAKRDAYTGGTIRTLVIDEGRANAKAAPAYVTD
ncbi:proteasome subunit beta [Pseudomonas chlororaphis]|uniref:proteasome subunit beta n=1 Tax=Pseudomonas chlororaphis TaxID=587753 RepID=UPI002368EF96|nr:proteasome subunit beta [Pseudomonas chlororaphis]WDG77350.1 proteasome subunit beta [Pseudomonas chlororaphis]WDG83411.1 proteasome subunit beta [Pseudomonas chlororaphis]